MSSSEAQPDATGSGAAAAVNRPCGAREACSFLNKFANSQRPGKPNFPTQPDPNYWLDALYRAYAELYLAVARLEKREYGMPTNPNDSIVSPPGPNPPPDKAGCPPPPGFP